MDLLTEKFLDDREKNFGKHMVFLRARDYDDKRQSPAEIKYEDIQKWNDPKVGGIKSRFSIFFHVNGDMGKVSSVHNRKNDDATTIYCLYADFDFGHEIKENMTSFPREEFQLTPSAIIETYNGFHVYWFLEEPLPVDIYKDRWTDAMVFLTEYLGSDPQVKNLARILRLPGCYYWSKKQGETDDPFEVRVIDYNPDLKYTLEDFEKIITAFDLVSSEKYIPDKKLKESGMGMKSAYDDIVRSVSAIDVLTDLDSHYGLSRGTRITEGGKETDGYRFNKNKNFIIDFSGKKRPSGTSFSVAKSILGSDYETFKYFASKWNVGQIFENNVKITSSEKKRGEDSIDEDGISTLVPSISNLGGHVDITIGETVISINYEDNKIYKISGDSKNEIVDASIKTLGYFLNEEQVNTYIVEWAKPGGTNGIIYLNKLGKKNELEKKLSEVGISYFGGSGKAEKAIIAYIHSSDNEMKYINELGIYDKKMIVNKYGKYITEDEKGNKYFCNINDIKPTNRNTDDIFSIGKNIKKDEFLESIRGLSRVYKESIIYSLFTHHALGMFANHIRKEFSRMPSASLVGTTSSGKTTARRLVMDMLGIDGCMELKASTTEFSVITLCKHNIPLSIGEYSNNELRFDRDPMLKNNYDGTDNKRGTQIQQLKIYPNNACFCIDGEVGSMTNSVITRQIAMRFSTQFKRGMPSERQKMNINGYFIRNFDKVKNIKKKYNEIRRPFMSEAFKNNQKPEKERVLDNYALLLAFADCFEFIDIVKDYLVEQCNTQFELLGESMIDKIIKQVFSVAILYKIGIQIINQKIIIELIMDFMRLNKNRYDDLISSVQNVNYHFSQAGLTEYSGSDRLEIPLDYVLKNSVLRPSFAMYLDSCSRFDNFFGSIEDVGSTILPLKMWAEQNGYKERPFYFNRLCDYKNVEHISNKNNQLNG